MTDIVVTSLLASLVLAVIHFFAGQFRFANEIPRSRWLSFAGGVSVAYALVHLLPELVEYGRVIAEAGGETAAEHRLYLISLAGLVVFYGLERFASRSREEGSREDSSDEETSPAVFWIHITSFAVYNALVGYTLVIEDRSLSSLGSYTLALGLHFLVNDYGLRRHHREQYRRYGRWILSAAVLAGWCVGVSTSIPQAVTAGLVGFLAGGILLNTFKEELPKERESRFWTFALGAAAYAALLVIA